MFRHQSSHQHRERLQEALSLVLRDAMRVVPPGATARLTAEASRDELHIALSGLLGAPAGEGRALAQRVVQAHAGRILDGASSVSIVIPRR